MTLMTRMLGVLLACYSLSYLAGGVLSQTNDPKSLRREDIVIRRNRPTIYLCADHKTDKNGTDVIWLRIYNNTIWTIRFGADRTGTSQKLLKLSSGSRVAGLTNESVAFPRYEFEPSETGAKKQGPEWGDVGTVSWLPSNTSASFSVPRGYFKLGTLFLKYKYEWEFTGAVADESYAPVHRVYFGIADLGDLSGHLCD
jgi:hypothetical protein